MVKRLSFDDNITTEEKLYAAKEKINEMVDVINYLCQFLSGSDVKVKELTSNHKEYIINSH